MPSGIGLADITTKRLVDKIDYAVTYKNCITGISLEKGAIPMHFANDREAVEVGVELHRADIPSGKQNRED